MDSYTFLAFDGRSITLDNLSLGAIQSGLSVACRLSSGEDCAVKELTVEWRDSTEDVPIESRGNTKALIEVETTRGEVVHLEWRSERG